MRGLLANKAFLEKTIDCIQIEVTPRCNNRCVFCPRTQAETDYMKPSDMPVLAYKKIAKYFYLTKAVHLQGWGEPLLHPFFTTLLEVAKESNLHLSFTTSGDLLDSEISQAIIDMGVDRVGVSLSGVTAKIHDNIRVGSSLERIRNNLTRLSKIKKDRKRKKPKIVLSYMMLKSNYHELPLLPELAREVGVGEVVLTNLDYVSSNYQDLEKVFSCTKEPKHIEKYIIECKKKAQKKGVYVRIYPLLLEEVPICELDPNRILYISSDGSVSPCVYLYTNSSSHIKRLFCGREYSLNQVTYGNINEQDFLEIWEDAEYKEFRSEHKKRSAANDTFSDMSFDISLLELQMKNREAKEIMRQNPYPLACRSCYKAYGI